MSTERNRESQVPVEVQTMIDEAFEICSYDPGRVKSTWVRRLTLEGTDGLLAILESPERKFVAVVNLPIIVMPVYGKILSVGDVMEVLTATPGIPNAQFPFRGNALFVVQCLPLGTIDEAKPGETMDSLKDSLNSFRRDLLAAIRHFHDIPVPEEDTYPKPVLPNIKMTPKDMRVILSLLESCNAQVQEIYTEIMESWVRSGNIVGTTSFSAVLDIPYGDRTARFAMLTPGLSKGRAVMIPAGRPYPPRIILFWGSLRKFYKGFPAECIDKYQKTVRKIAPIHTTRASAYIEMSDKFDVSAARSLLKAMRTLAKTVRPEMVGKPGTSGPVTPDNIRQTLLTCLVPVQEIYRQLMDGWKAAGGSVQCAKPGRIYLRMKTKEHARGWFAKIRRNFNLVVLAGPRNKKPANMQICWNLATVGSAAYLDCIPEEVDRFEKVIAALPGFERKGTITYLWIGEEFNPDKTALLLEAMVRLRKAEQASI